MNTSLNGKKALVCGASQGIGRATAETLAVLGATVTAVARSERALAELVSVLPGSGHAYVVADFDQPDEAMRALDAHRDAHILINNAGGPPGGPIVDADDEAFLTAFRRHLLMNQRLVQHCLPAMRDAGYGRIINIISTSVYEPIPGLGVSNTIRGAVASWAKTLASELGPDQITVNNVLPGFTDTGRLSSLIEGRAKSSGKSADAVAEGMRAQVPFGRFGRPEEIANVIAFLASPAAAYVSGQSIAADGGRSRSI